MSIFHLEIILPPVQTTLNIILSPINYKYCFQLLGFFRICKAIYSNIHTCAILFVVAGQFGGKCISNSYKHKFKILFVSFQ